MKSLLSLLACVTLCSCATKGGPYTTMYKLHKKNHIKFNHYYDDCILCKREKQELEKSMYVGTSVDQSTINL